MDTMKLQFHIPEHCSHNIQHENLKYYAVISNFLTAQVKQKPGQQDTDYAVGWMTKESWFNSQKA